MGVLKAKVAGNWLPLEYSGGANPQNALGIVAVGAMKPYSGTLMTANVSTMITENIVYQTQVGRRYRLCVRARAMAPVSTTCYAYLKFEGGGIGNNDTYRVLTTTYDALDAQLLFDGTGVVSTYWVSAFGNQNWQLWVDQAVSHFYLEDVGPNAAPALPLPATPQAWTPVTFTNGWVNYGTGFSLAAYRKIGDEVQIRGFVKNGTIPGAIFTLPVGFRPPTHLHLPTVSFSAWAYLVVNSSGAIEPQNGNPGWFSIDDICFSVTP